MSSVTATSVFEQTAASARAAEGLFAVLVPAALCALLLAPSLAAANSTLVAGSAVSGTGHVIVAQSTEVPGRAVSTKHHFPAQQHRSNEIVPYIDGIEVPQVPHTNGLFMTITRALQPDGRLLSRESLLNDKGVLVIQNVLPAAKRLRLSAEELSTPINGLFTDPDRLRAENSSLDIPARPDAPDDALRYVLPTPSDYEKLDQRLRRKLGRSAALRSTAVNSAVEAASIPAANTLDILAEAPSGILGGIGRIMAERGNSARQAVLQAVELIERFGYRGPVLEYTVADAKEAWIVALFPGRTAVARRIADDEIVFTAQTSSLGTADLSDRSTTIVTDFTRRRAQALLEAAQQEADARQIRMPERTELRPERTVFRLEDHVDPPTDQARRLSHQREFAVRRILAPETLGSFPADWRQFWTASGWRGGAALTIDKVKTVLREHAPGHDASGVCNAATARSDIWELNPNPLLIRMTSSDHRPGESLFVPSHPLASPESRSASLPAPLFDTNAQDARTIRQLHAVLLSLLRQEGARDDFESVRDAYESQAAEDVAAAEKNALFLADKVSAGKARQRLWSTDARLQALADARTASHIAELDPVRLTILADQLKPRRRTVKVVIFGSDVFNAAKVQKRGLRLLLPDTDGSGRADPNLAEASSVVRHDYDGDGRIDAILNFPISKLLAVAPPDTYLTLFVVGKADGKAFVGFDTVVVNAGASSSSKP